MNACVIAYGQTGSGKTLAFALPVLSDIIDFLKNATLEQLPQVMLGLIITPTR
jgi:superfamily II DNA/RNA helicase